MNNKLRYSLVSFFTLFIISTMPLITEAQAVDNAPNGNKNYLPVEGGVIKENIDLQTPLNVLIKRFEQRWQFEETGKSYWIGYTNNMFSIAARKDSAISPLLNFIISTHNPHAKLGAVYTLHLIGIESRIAGRFHEEFNNRAARKALLSLLKYEDLMEPVMCLLIRDPWLSDVPALFRLMGQSKSSCWSVVNSLKHYGLTNIPLSEPIPDKIANEEIKFPYTNLSILERNYDFEAQMQQLLKAIKSLHNPNIQIETSLFGMKLWGNIKYKINGQVLDKNTLTTTVGAFLSQVVSKDSNRTLASEFSDTGNKIQYFITNDMLFICSANTAKTKLLNWWGEQSLSYKQQFTEDISHIRQKKG